MKYFVWFFGMILLTLCLSHMGYTYTVNGSFSLSGTLANQIGVAFVFFTIEWIDGLRKEKK